VGQYGRIPDPFDALRKQAPRTGPPVQNMGGTPSLPPSPTVKTVVPSPALQRGAPGPQGAALPAAPPLTLPPPPPGYKAQEAPGETTPPGWQANAFNRGYLPGHRPRDGYARALRAKIAGEGEGGPPQGPADPAMQPAPTVVKTTQTTTQPMPQAPARPQAAPPGGPYQVIGSRPEMPSEEELQALGHGQGVTTPHGDVYRGPDGSLKLRLNDAGKQAYEEERARKLSTFGVYPGHDDPAAPPPPLTPGIPSFNPFTGQWSE
jgi:hypothetical protein